jgi:DNA end-binding protein Ku
MAATIWKGHITFGLISLPVKMMAAARPETVSFNQLHKHDNSRVKQVLFCIAEDKPVPRSELVKGFEYEKDRYVVIDDEDLKRIQPKTAKVMEIVEFVKEDELDSVYLEASGRSWRKSLWAALQSHARNQPRGHCQNLHAQS